MITIEPTKCTLSLETKPAEPLCPEKSYSAIVLFIFYEIFIIILLFNMLIALFTNSYQRIQDQSRRIWATDKYILVVSGLNMLPLGIFNPLVQLLLFIWALIAFIIALILSPGIGCPQFEKNG